MGIKVAAAVGGSTVLAKIGNPTSTLLVRHGTATFLTAQFMKVTLQGSFKNKEACPSLGCLGGIFGGYLEEIWRTFRGDLEEN